MRTAEEITELLMAEAFPPKPKYDPFTTETVHYCLVRPYAPNRLDAEMIDRACAMVQDVVNDMRRTQEALKAGWSLYAEPYQANLRAFRRGAIWGGLLASGVTAALAGSVYGLLLLRGG